MNLLEVTIGHLILFILRPKMKFLFQIYLFYIDYLLIVAVFPSID